MSVTGLVRHFVQTDHETPQPLQDGFDVRLQVLALGIQVEGVGGTGVQGADVAFTVFKWRISLTEQFL